MTAKPKKFIIGAVIVVVISIIGSAWTWYENHLPLPEFLASRIHSGAVGGWGKMHESRWNLLAKRIREESEALEIIGTIWRDHVSGAMIQFGKNGKIRWIEEPDFNDRTKIQLGDLNLVRWLASRNYRYDPTAAVDVVWDSRSSSSRGEMNLTFPNSNGMGGRVAFNGRELMLVVEIPTTNRGFIQLLFDEKME